MAKAEGSATGEPLWSGIVAFDVASTELEEVVGVPGRVVLVSCAKTEEQWSKATKQRGIKAMMTRDFWRVQQTLSLQREQRGI